jgi:hypothetical protein
MKIRRKKLKTRISKKRNKIKSNDLKGKYLGNNNSDTYTPEKTKNTFAVSENNTNALLQTGRPPNHIQYKDNSVSERDSAKDQKSESEDIENSSTSYDKEKLKKELTSNHIANMVKASPSDLGEEPVSSP